MLVDNMAFSVKVQRKFDSCFMFPYLTTWRFMCLDQLYVCICWGFRPNELWCQLSSLIKNRNGLIFRYLFVVVH